MQRGSLSTILKPCTATPLPIALVFSEWEGVAGSNWIYKCWLGVGESEYVEYPEKTLTANSNHIWHQQGGLIQGHIERRKMLSLLPKNEGWRMAAL